MRYEKNLTNFSRFAPGRFLMFMDDQQKSDKPKMSQEARFRRAVRLFAELQKQNLCRKCNADQPDDAHAAMRKCRCGRPKQLSQNLCFDCQDALLILRARYTDAAGTLYPNKSPPRVLTQAVQLPQAAKRPRPIDLSDASFDDVVKLYENNQ